MVVLSIFKSLMSHPTIVYTAAGTNVLGGKTIFEDKGLFLGRDPCRVEGALFWGRGPLHWNRGHMDDSSLHMLGIFVL